MLQKDLPAVDALSFLGDAVHSRYVRDRLVRSGISHARELNAAALHHVTATAQAAQYERVRDLFSEEEQDVFRRAFNTSHINRPKNVSGVTYRTATGFEAVLGMHAYLGNETRIVALMDTAWLDEIK